MPLTKAQINRVRALRDKRAREAEGLFVVEGEKVVTELLGAGFTFTEIYATLAWEPAAVSGPPVERVTEQEMARLSHYPTPSPVLAIGALRLAQLEAGELESGLTLALDGIQDPGNVGTLLRIADWFGCRRVLLSPDCADLFSQKVINASMGSFARIRAIRTDLLATLQQRVAVPILGCDLDGTSVYDVAPLDHAVVVVGSEGRGLSPAVAAQLSQRVTIPRWGAAESLNAAVAAGIVCAQLRRG